MSEWWTYTISDFLLFAPRTYYRLFDLYNADLWPAHVATLVLGVALAVSPRGASAARTRGWLAALALSWGLVGWAFHFRRYATINWAADYFAVAFALESAALAAVALFGLRRGAPAPSRAAAWTGRALLVLAVAIYPLLAPIAGRTFREAEVFGLAPDPTAVGTLGALLLLGGAPRGALAVVPILWCVTSGLFLWAMGAAQAPLAPLAAIAAVAAIAVATAR